MRNLGDEVREAAGTRHRRHPEEDTAGFVALGDCLSDSMSWSQRSSIDWSNGDTAAAGYGARFLSRVTQIKGCRLRLSEPMVTVRRCSQPTAAFMRIGDQVLYHGRVLVLLGHDPMSVPDRRAEVEDPETGERFVVLLDELEPASLEPEGFDPAA